MIRRHDPMSPRYWAGGFYELALQVASAGEARLGGWVAALVEAVGLSHATVDHGAGLALVDPAIPAGARRAAAAIARGAHLRGVVRLPGGAESPCGLLLLRGVPADVGEPGTGRVPGDDATGHDQLVLYFPLAGLDAAGVGVGAFPFDDRSGGESLAWRRPLDEWLAGAGRAVHPTVRFRRAVIGFEVAGDDEGSADAGPTTPAPSDRAHVVAGPNGLTYIAAER